LGGSEPAKIAAAARVGAEYGYDEINLNIGCPSDRVQAGRFGACLMREPELVADCVRAMQEAVRDCGKNVPVTVKCRIGVDEQDEYADLQRFAETMLAAGVRILIVHARKAWLQGLSPKENREIPPLNYERVYRLKRELPQLTMVINGGILQDDAVPAHLRHVEGVMLGRLAYHDPYALARVDAMLFSGVPIVREHALSAMRPYIEAELARGTKLKHIARHLLGLHHGQPGGRAFRRVLSEGAHHEGAGWHTVEAAMQAMAGRATRAA
ncbi:MAG: tRNA dihydrouridine(20/20a) synthase DusA, partial [Rhodanobacteraceae bacterium]